MGYIISGDNSLTLLSPKGSGLEPKTKPQNITLGNQKMKQNHRKPIRAYAQRSTMSRAVSAAVIASAMATPAWSQTLEEVLVTATKRSESVQDVPLAITALSGDFISKMNLQI